MLHRKSDTIQLASPLSLAKHLATAKQHMTTYKRKLNEVSGIKTMILQC